MALFLLENKKSPRSSPELMVKVNYSFVEFYFFPEERALRIRSLPGVKAFL